jgi:Zn-dependent protease
VSDDQLILSAILIAVFLLVAFPIHEFAHAFAAYRLGDSTARLMGRLTLDPRVHFDPIGGIFLAVTILVGVGIGWAKPTPVNPLNLRGGRYGEAIVAAAGPASNLILATAAAIPLRYALATGLEVPLLVLQFLSSFVLINLFLMVFNFVPVPPLDGSKLLFAAMSPQMSWRWRPVLEQYGFLILLVLIIPIAGQSILGLVLGRVVDPIYGLLVGI